MATVSEALVIATSCHEAGQLELAEEIYLRILRTRPEHAAAHHMLGLIALEQRRLGQAVEHFQSAIGHDGAQAAYHHNLGRALSALGRLDEAAASYHRALVLDPSSADTENGLAFALQRLGRFEEAEAACRRALGLRPGYAAAENNLGNALAALGRMDEALAAFRRAIAADPQFSPALSNLGAILQSRNQFDEAIRGYRQAVAVDPRNTDAMSNLGTALRSVGLVEEAREAFRQALGVRPDSPITHSNALFLEHYRPGVTPAELQTQHAEWNRRHAAVFQGSWLPHANVRDAERTLRVGFVSADLGEHPVGRFLVRMLESLDQGACATFCYSDRHGEDALGARLRNAAGAWRSTRPLGDAALAEQIRADRIDILFDLAGHTAHNRLLVFARKPAPIQITWAGYVGTTGLSAMDYLLADRHHVPAGAEPHYCERILRMPDGYVCYDPPAEAPAVGPLPAWEQGLVTFGSFNKPAKVGAQVVEVWARILRRLPGSRLVLKHRGYASSASERLLGQFQALGVAPERVSLGDWSSPGELPAHYRRVDIALDTFPYSGGATTCEALWMGVPVVTCPGETFASRHSLSHLSTVGLTETIAGDLDEYVELAVGLASDLPRLARLRSGLRAQMARSPLCDGRRFAESFAQRMRGVWRRWV